MTLKRLTTHRAAPTVPIQHTRCTVGSTSNEGCLLWDAKDSLGGTQWC